MAAKLAKDPGAVLQDALVEVSKTVQQVKQHAATLRNLHEKGISGVLRLHGLHLCKG